MIGKSTNKKTVFFSTPEWHLSGVNTMTARLVRELCAAGYDARILFTDLNGKSLPDSFLKLNIPFEVIPIKPRVTTLGRQWKPLIDFLTGHSPCIFVPNYDFAAGVVSSVLPSTVGVIGTLRSFEAVYFEQLQRLGRFWNRCVAVSECLRAQAASEYPEFADKLIAIPNGVDLPTEGAVSSRGSGPLRLVYAGRIARKQKRAIDLIHIAEQLKSKNLDFVLNVAGDGPEFGEVHRLVAEKGLEKTVVLHGRLDEAALNRLYGESHVVLLVSKYEGMPNSVLEAMAYGCVPVCSRTRSGAVEFIEQGKNGYVVPIGVIRKFAEVIALLEDRKVWAECSAKSVATVREHYSISLMVEKWSAVLDDAFEELVSGRYMRKRNRIRSRPEHGIFNVFLSRTRIAGGRWLRAVTCRKQ